MQWISSQMFEGELPETRWNQQRTSTKHKKFIWWYCVWNIICQKNKTLGSYWLLSQIVPFYMLRRFLRSVSALYIIYIKKVDWLSIFQRKQCLCQTTKIMLKMCNHYKILHQKLWKYNIDICLRTFPDDIHKTGNFPSYIDLSTMELVLFTSNASPKWFHLKQLIWKKK